MVELLCNPIKQLKNEQILCLILQKNPYIIGLEVL